MSRKHKPRPLPASASSPATIANESQPRRWADPQLWMTIGIAIALLGSAWAVDPSVDRGFDAPKRLLFFVGTVVAFVATCLHRPISLPVRPDWRAHLPLLLLGLGIVFALLACLSSPWPLDVAALRYYLALLMLLWIGTQATWQTAASARRVWLIALAAVGVNVVISGLQHAGLPSPIEVIRLGGRFDAGALMGNEGMVSLSAALLAPALLAMSLAQRGVRRTALWMGVGVCLLVIALNRQLTSLLAVSAGLLCVWLLIWRRRAAVQAVLVVGLLGFLILAIPAVRQPVLTQLGMGSIAEAQLKTTYRLGAVAAALEMIAERPLLGHGPGRYAQDSQRFRLRASERWRNRLEMPPNANAFVYAHQDSLQWAAEFGLPSLIACLAGFLWLLVRLIRRAWQVGQTEAKALAGVLMTASVLSLAWFPLHIPLLAALTSLAIGRAWRLTEKPGDTP